MCWRINVSFLYFPIFDNNFYFTIFSFRFLFFLLRFLIFFIKLNLLSSFCFVSFKVSFLYFPKKNLNLVGLELLNFCGSFGWMWKSIGKILCLLFIFKKKKIISWVCDETWEGSEKCLCFICWGFLQLMLSCVMYNYMF